MTVTAVELFPNFGALAKLDAGADDVFVDDGLSALVCVPGSCALVRLASSSELVTDLVMVLNSPLSSVTVSVTMVNGTFAEAMIVDVGIPAGPVITLGIEVTTTIVLDNVRLPSLSKPAIEY